MASAEAISGGFRAVLASRRSCVSALPSAAVGTGVVHPRVVGR